LGKIAIDCLRIVILATVLVRSERSIGYAPNIEFLISDEDEFSLYGWPQTFPDCDMLERIKIEFCNSGGPVSFEKRQNRGIVPVAKTSKSWSIPFQPIPGSAPVPQYTGLHTLTLRLEAGPRQPVRPRVRLDFRILGGYFG
jgi:hypothetical protein